MKRAILTQLVDDKIEELRSSIKPNENGERTYPLFKFCVEVIPDDERQSKHVDILEYLQDQGIQIRWKGIKFQPVNSNCTTTPE